VSERGDRHVRHVALGLCLLTAAGGQAIAGVSGKALYRAGVSVSDADRGDLVLSDKLAQLGWSGTPGFGWRAKGVARYRREEALEPDAFKELSLRELTAKRDAASWSLSLGKQQVVWGKADGFPLLDVVNPYDTREFVLDDTNRSRMPLWLADASYYWSGQSLQMLVIPDVKTNRLPEAGGLFYPNPDVPAGVNLDVAHVDEPAQTPHNWEAGLRWEGRAGDWELGAIAFRGWSNKPVYFTEAEGPTTLRVTPRPVRRTWLGVDGDVPYGSLVWRFEAAYTPDGYRTVTGPGGVPEQQRTSLANAVIGVDWTPSNWLLSAQLFQFEDAPGKPSDLASFEGQYLSVLAEKYFLQRRLKLRVFTMTGLEREDLWVSAKTSYRFARHYKVGVKLDLLGGEPDAFFGRYANRDRIAITLGYHF
jgi:hypothetical protein